MGNGESIAGGQTGILAQDPYVWYRAFMMEYPSGLQTLHEFKALLGLQGLNQKANEHVDQVYNTFDTNKVRLFTFHLAMILHVSSFFSSCPYNVAIGKNVCSPLNREVSRQPTACR